MSAIYGSIQYGTQRYRQTAADSALPAPLSIDSRSYSADWDDEQTYSADWDDEQTISLLDFAMTKTGVQITALVIGDTKRITRTYTDLPTGSTVATAYLTVKKRDTFADAAAVVQKSITTSATSSGQITDAVTTGGSIAMYFDLSKTETANFVAGIAYVYDVQVILSGGEVHTMEKGTMTWVRSITDASS